MHRGKFPLCGAFRQRSCLSRVMGRPRIPHPVHLCALQSAQVDAASCYPAAPDAGPLGQTARRCPYLGCHKAETSQGARRLEGSCLDAPAPQREDRAMKISHLLPMVFVSVCVAAPALAAVRTDAPLSLCGGDKADKAEKTEKSETTVNNEKKIDKKGSKESKDKETNGKDSA